VIKVVLAMRHGMLPPSLNVDRPNPYVDWSAGAVSLLTEPVEWREGERPRRAGVSSFGVSGTNAHLILEGPPASAPSEKDGGGPARVVPWLISARSEKSLRAQAAALVAHVEEHPGLSVADAAWALATTRPVFEHRAVVVGEGRQEMTAGLRAVAAGGPTPVRNGKTAWAFGGESPQPGAGAELYERFPAFADAVDEVGKLLERVPRELLGDGPVGLFAQQVGLVRLLETAGLRPGTVIGHAVGEIAAAYAAGVFDLADACRLISRSAGREPGSARFVEPVAGSGGADIVLELGACPVLPTEVRPPVVLSMLGGEGSASRALFTALALLHSAGEHVSWAALLDGEPPPHTVALPTYAFQRERYWPYDTAPAASDAERRESDAERREEVREGQAAPR
jgi:acyl transferase domain-containing protein